MANDDIKKELEELRAEYEKLKNVAVVMRGLLVDRTRDERRKLIIADQVVECVDDLTK